MGSVVIGRSVFVIERYSTIEVAFDFRFLYVNLTSLGLPVLPEVVNNRAKSLSSKDSILLFILINEKSKTE